MQHAARLLTTPRPDAEAPFAVFWGNSEDLGQVKETDALLDTLASMIDRLGGAEPMNIIVHLARKFRGTE